MLSRRQYYVGAISTEKIGFKVVENSMKKWVQITWEDCCFGFVVCTVYSVHSQVSRFLKPRKLEGGGLN